jgi:hypothetical protein
LILTFTGSSKEEGHHQLGSNRCGGGSSRRCSNWTLSQRDHGALGEKATRHCSKSVITPSPVGNASERHDIVTTVTVKSRQLAGFRESYISMVPLEKSSRVGECDVVIGFKCMITGTITTIEGFSAEPCSTIPTLKLEARAG